VKHTRFFISPEYIPRLVGDDGFFGGVNSFKDREEGIFLFKKTFCRKPF
jgi:hypothetical protein